MSDSRWRMIPVPSLIINRELKQRRRRRQRERQQIGKTATLHVHHAFTYISLQSLHDYDEKVRTLYGDLSPISSSLQIRRLQFSRHCWRSKNETGMDGWMDGGREGGREG